MVVVVVDDTHDAAVEVPCGLLPRAAIRRLAPHAISARKVLTLTSVGSDVVLCGRVSDHAGRGTPVVVAVVVVVSVVKVLVVVGVCC